MLKRVALLVSLFALAATPAGVGTVIRTARRLRRASRS